MNNKLIFLIVVLVLLFGLILIINKNRNAREKTRMEEKIHSERQQFVQDSLQNIRAINNKTKFGVEGVTSTIKGGGNNPTPGEDFRSYINTSIKNSSSKTNIAIIVVDDNGNISSSISSTIADIYNQAGYIGNTGLIRSSFVHKSSFQELFEGNSEIIEKLKLSSYTDYIMIGKIKYSTRQGTLVDETFICTITLTMNIISANQRKLIKSFNCSVNGNGATEEQAKEYAIDKLISKYKFEYSTI
jgi:hypothetical protein